MEQQSNFNPEPEYDTPWSEAEKKAAKKSTDWRRYKKLLMALALVLAGWLANVTGMDGGLLTQLMDAAIEAVVGEPVVRDSSTPAETPSAPPVEQPAQPESPFVTVPEPSDQDLLENVSQDTLKQMSPALHPLIEYEIIYDEPPPTPEIEDERADADVVRSGRVK